MLTQEETISNLREALTNCLCTLQGVWSYAIMSKRDQEAVKEAMEFAESTLQQTDELK